MKKLVTLLFVLMALCVNTWATLIEWTASDLATVNVEMGYDSPGESQTINGITVTNNAIYVANEYCHFFYQEAPADYCGFSMRDGGSLTFAPESGQLTRIAIHCQSYPGDMTLAYGWEWDGENEQLVWIGNSSAVLLHGDNSSTSFTSGPITLIEFTVSGFVPTTTTTWEVADLATINVGKENGAAIQDVNLSQTVKTITVAAEAPTPVGEEWNSSYINGDMEYGGSLGIVSAGSLIFTAPEGYLLKKIVITGNGCNSGYPLSGSEYLISGWTWNENTCSLIWSGDVASSVELACDDQEFGYINFSLIQSIVFTLAEDVVVDTREVPVFKFSNDLTEATIILDDYGWTFEPGTSYSPLTDYTVYVKNGIVYYQEQPYEDWREPSQLDEPLPMTYAITSSTPSIPNTDVISLTATEGDGFSFDVVNFGDVIVTASTVGNTRFQPASTTFTIHVVEGKAATRECVLSFANGEIVPDDYEFNLETGDEFVNLELREKENPYHPVYAPSFSIWGSKNYYIASLAGEKTLRALTAGTDTFTVQYARYQTGDMNGEFRILKFPVHIKSSKPAMTSSLNFSTSPVTNPNLVFNAEYNGASQQINVNGTLTDEQVKFALDNYAYGSPAWKSALPNTISFELAAGEGDFSITCQVLNSNYEVRVLRYGQTIPNRYDNPTPETHNIHYNIATQKAVVIYVAEKPASPATKRAPAAKQDDPLAMLSALVMTPTYPIAANVDPDQAGVYYSTHYNEMQKYMLPDGTEAYVATISGGDMNLTKVAEGGQVIPADEAFILRSNAASVVLTPTDAEPVTVSASNDLIGTDSEKAAPANCYVLSGHSTDNLTTGVGFYAFSGNIPAHKAYVIYGGSAAPKRMRFIFNNEQTVTGVESVTGDGLQVTGQKLMENGVLYIIKNGVRYNAQGQIVK